MLTPDHAWNVAILLGCITDAGADVAARTGNVAAQKPGLTGSGLEELQQALHEGALAGTIGAQKADGTRGIDTETS